MTYGERIKEERRQDKLPVIHERRQPEWLRRMQEGQLPAKDLTDRVKAA